MNGVLDCRRVLASGGALLLSLLSSPQAMGGTPAVDPQVKPGATITLEGTQLIVDKALQILDSGLSNGLTIDAGGRSRVR